MVKIIKLVGKYYPCRTLTTLQSWQNLWLSLDEDSGESDCRWFWTFSSSFDDEIDIYSYLFRFVILKPSGWRNSSFFYSLPLGSSQTSPAGTLHRLCFLQRSIDNNSCSDKEKTIRMILHHFCGLLFFVLNSSPCLPLTIIIKWKLHFFECSGLPFKKGSPLDFLFGESSRTFSDRKDLRLNFSSNKRNWRWRDDAVMNKVYWENHLEAQRIGLEKLEPKISKCLLLIRRNTWFFVIITWSLWMISWDK